MALDVASVRLSVLGPADLLVTALVAALASHGVDAERLAPADVLAEPDFPRRGPGVLLVDIDRQPPAPVIPRAVAAGLVVLALGAEANRERVAAAIAAGAVGWIRTTTSVDTLADTVRLAAAGRLQMSPARRAAWLAEHREAYEAARAGYDRLEQLSPREREVLLHIAEGRRAAEIAATLFLSIATVRSHIRAILVKLGVNSQVAAAEVYRDTTRRLAKIVGSGQAVR